MKIDALLTNDSILVELGRRVAQVRHDLGLSQAELAEEAGVSRRTIQNLESGAVSVQLATLVRVSRVLGLVDRIDQLIPEVAQGPMDRYLIEARKSGSMSDKKSQYGAGGTWKWGDE